jgi:hypothetical protein
MQAEDYIQTMTPVDFIYLDPQRRTENRKGLYRLADCSPDITALLPVLRQKAGKVMIKTSPMLDIAQSLQELAFCKEIHIVEARGECKEVLYILDFSKTIAVTDIPITAVALDDEGRAIHSLRFTKSSESPPQTSLPLRYLYEPGPAFQKSGGFGALASQFDVFKLHKNTHLYTSQVLRRDFPGRCFEILDVLPVDRKSLSGLKQLNLTLRNFPAQTEDLKKQLGLRDGGDDYAFACTLSDERKALILCRKAEI